MVEICECCGARMIAHRHTLARGLVSALYKLARAGGHNVDLTADTKLSFSERTNFGHLQYWRLVTSDYEPEGKRGVWSITDNGIRFLAGRLALPKGVVVYRRQVIKYYGEKITVHQVKDGWKYWIDYVRTSEPVGQQTLFDN